MNTKDFRAAVVERILTWASTDYPTLPVVTENGPRPDENTIGKIWLDCEIRFYSGQNISIGFKPMGRMTGAVSAQVYFREGEGTGLPDDIVDGLIDLLKNFRVGSATLEYPQRVVPTNFQGWYKTGILVPFQLDGA